ncbi:MAG: ECF transporter S component [Candidatus Fimimonas sp.]
MKLKNIVRAALFCALICVATAFLQIPLPITGYVHLGDAVIFLACVFLPFPYAAAAAAVGSALADVLSGWVSYAPVTLVVKFVMACVFCAVMRGKKWQFVVGAILASLWMAVGYGAYEFVLYGAEALANMPFNVLQGTVGMLIAFVAAFALQRFWKGEQRGLAPKRQYAHNKK